MHNVSFFISTKTGLPPAKITAFADATKLLVGTITSPPFKSKYLSAISNAEVPELTAIAFFTPIYPANSFSNLLTFGPNVSVPVCRLF